MQKQLLCWKLRLETPYFGVMLDSIPFRSYAGHDTIVVSNVTPEWNNRSEG